MSRTRPYEHRRCDLDTREEVAEFVTRFYREIAQDDRFHLYFETIARVDWHAHALDLTNFWAGLLLGEVDRDAGAVIEAHRWLHDAAPFDAALFERWLEILDTSLDSGWTGPITEHARKRGHGFAWAMAKRLAGVDLRSGTDPASRPSRTGPVVEPLL
jgi:hemoglobin